MAYAAGKRRKRIENEVKAFKYTRKREKKQRNLERKPEKNLYYHKSKVNYGYDD